MIYVMQHGARVIAAGTREHCERAAANEERATAEVTGEMPRKLAFAKCYAASDALPAWEAVGSGGVFFRLTEWPE